jgi:hypothetical protein
VVDADEPSVTVLRNEAGQFKQVQRIADHPARAAGPFPVPVGPHRLLG